MAIEKCNFPIPKAVKIVCATFQDADETAYLVGGSLRDLFIGSRPDDWDIATTASPAKTMTLFPKVIPTGIEHGTVTVIINGLHIEVTTLRGEGNYSDGRHPDSVTFLNDINEDLARRDFTINAIAWNPLTEELLDPFHGRQHVEQGIIQAVGEPARRFKEDGLRIMRGARFAATLGFEIESQTRQAMGLTAANLANVSTERKRDELFKTLKAPIPSHGLSPLGQGTILHYVCPPLSFSHVKSKEYERWIRTLKRVDETPPALPVRLAALLFDVSDRALIWLESMLLDKKTKKLVSHFLSFGTIEHTEHWSDSQVRRFVSRASKDQVDNVLALQHAVLKSDGKNTYPLTTLKQRIGTLDCMAAPLCVAELAVDGKDLINSLNIRPGPYLGALLNTLLDAVLEKPESNTKDTLLALASVELTKLQS